MTTATRQTLIDALAAVIDAAPPAETAALAEALEQYAFAYPTSYHAMTRSGTMVASLLDCIEDHSEAMIPLDDFGRPDATLKG